jgi:hypothetical protein
MHISSSFGVKTSSFHAPNHTPCSKHASPCLSMNAVPRRPHTVCSVLYTLFSLLSPSFVRATSLPRHRPISHDCGGGSCMKLHLGRTQPFRVQVTSAVEWDGKMQKRLFILQFCMSKTFKCSCIKDIFAFNFLLLLPFHGLGMISSVEM